MDPELHNRLCQAVLDDLTASEDYSSPECEPEGPAKSDIKTCVTNEDNEELEVRVKQGVFFGHVHEVNGTGAESMPMFVATRHELLLLFLHWARTYIRVRFDEVDSQSTDHCKKRLKDFACRRFQRIGRLLGEEEANSHWKACVIEIGPNRTPEDWMKFLHWDADPEGACD